MPNSQAEYSKQLAIIEREFRNCKRNITGTATAGKLAVDQPETAYLYEAQVEAAVADFESLQNAWKRLWEIHTLIGSSPTEDLERDYDSSRQEIIVAKAHLKEIQRRRALESSGQNGASVDTSQSRPTTLTQRPHLPPISVPRFSGDWIQWPQFRDTFQSVVHNDPILTDIERLHYLLGALSGEAASLIAKFPIEEKSYPLAWKRLKENYDNPRILGTLFLKRILEGQRKGPGTELELYEHFLINVADSIEGFRALSLEDPAEFLMGSLALRALDAQTRRNFELTCADQSVFPKADDIISFVRKRKNAVTMSRDFSALSPPSNHHKQKRNPESRPPSRGSLKYFPKHSSVNFHTSEGPRAGSPAVSRSGRGTSAVSSKGAAGRPSGFKRPGQGSGTPRSSQVCPYCKESHPLAGCVKFSDLARAERIEFVRSIKCCKNCLRFEHATADCCSKWNCRFCNMRHHSLIHEDRTTTNSVPNKPSGSSGLNSTSLTSLNTDIPQPLATLLGTAQILVSGREGRLHRARAIIDSGSQQTIISRNLAHRVGLHTSPHRGNIIGLGGSPVSKPIGTARCHLMAKSDGARYATDAVVVENVTPFLPNFVVPEEKVRRLRSSSLADQQFWSPGAVDVLIGMDLYPNVITGAPYSSGVDQLFFIPTVFGLVIVGSLNEATAAHEVTLYAESRERIEENLKAFWEVEEPKPVERQDPDERLCEEHFIETTSRATDGRYMVRLPFRPNHEPLGRNRELATKRLLSLERKFKSDENLAEHYVKFMKDYQEMGHLSPALVESNYLIPHHGIWQQRSSGKKLRVVFDASCSSSATVSLNSILMPGPKLQSDIGTILLNFRLFRVPLCADLVMMYRQILVHPDDRRHQHIIWRATPEENVIEMELNTVTYGLRPSAYQAQRVIKQLMIDEGDPFPLAVRAVDSSMYVDDIVSGADNIEQARELQQQLISLFAKGGFSLSKWASTASALIPHDEEMEPVHLNPPDSESVKVLGLIWNPNSDCFSYSISQPPTISVTKRTILSAMARIFDPLGLLSPVVLLVKVLLQDIWKLELEWDQAVPQEIRSAWLAITEEWGLLPLFSIPRFIGSRKHSLRLIGFCDASTRAYAASVYIRTEDSNDEVHTTLIKAKTKVAPLKYTSIARLELCGALLLARVLASITDPEMNAVPPICYTDSSVVLSWLHMPVHQLKVFEANRVAEILSTTSANAWRHVRSSENPSDVASRGCLPSVLKGRDLWWSGPSWLRESLESWTQPQPISTLQAPCSHNVSHLAVSDSPSQEIMSRFSNYHTLIRVVARILRLLNIVRAPEKREGGPISAAEFGTAKIRCVRMAQRELNLKHVAQLSPFHDELNIVRVGGRLQAAPIEMNAKHPILLPRKCHFSRLVVRDIHERHYHCGPSLALAILRCEFWILGALRLIRSVINDCAHCRIQKAQPIYPMMAPLPKERFSSRRAFLHVGLDYAGPFTIKQGNLRKSPTSKAYLCLFVCLSTKALHLEAVSSLATETFLAALDRFVARRGLPSVLWSDRGTNFVGASAYLKDLYKFVNQKQEHLVAWAAPKGVTWKFNPPHAPHFGGIWEAGVKSVKALLTGRVGPQHLTFEELTTIFARVEQILNSRPLCAINEDPENCNFLTPAHFIIGESLTGIPETRDDAIIKSPRDRWEIVQRHISHIWDRWRLEYLHSIQQRGKWKTPVPNIEVGQLVILNERRCVIGQWPVARVVQVHPGEDGFVRTVSVKTPSGKTYVRPVVALAPLFHQSDNMS